MNSFLELVKNRQSERAFDPNKPVDRNVLRKIIEICRLSPSACNAQPWHFIIVDNPVLKDKIAKATSSRLLTINHFTRQAPVHVIIVEENVNLSSGIGGFIKKRNFAPIDIGVVAAHFVLAAKDEGLGSCILGWFDEAKIKELLDIPKNKRVLLDIVLGYSTQALREKKRKDIEEIFSYNSYHCYD